MALKLWQGVSVWKKNVLYVVLLKMVISFLIEILLYDNQLLKNITIFLTKTLIAIVVSDE